ncbi:MAG: hypothetical protein GYA21_18225 [Myxococcales bacterium]|nr:hypothetical protein [Myxococcales bacterium]
MKTMTSILLLTLISASAGASEGHFLPGQMRGGLSWDNVSAMEQGILRFGAAFGVTVMRGLEVGYEQQFIVPKDGYESRSWGYLRLVPFSEWYVNPFLSARTGYYAYDNDRKAFAGGVGGGLIMFIDRHFAFEASLFTQWVVHGNMPTERQVDFDWRVTLYF